MAGIAWVPVALTYNSLATMIQLLGIALLARLLLPVSSARTSPGVRWSLIVAFFGALTCLMLVKPPAALATAALGYFLVCFCAEMEPRHRRRLVIAGFSFVGAFVFALLAMVLLRSEGGDRLFQLGANPIRATWVQSTLIRYGAEIARMLPALAGDFAWTVVPMFAACAAALFGPTAAGPRARWRVGSLAV